MDLFQRIHRTCLAARYRIYPRATTGSRGHNWEIVVVTYLRVSSMDVGRVSRKKCVC